MAFRLMCHEKGQVVNRQGFITDLNINGRRISIFDIQKLEQNDIADIRRLPFSIKILVENLLRKWDDRIVTETDIMHIARWASRSEEPIEIPYHPARVLMQDFTGVPAVVDLAAMRDAVKDLGGDPGKINPLVPVELVVDHSVQVDYYGTAEAIRRNVEKEYARNSERYALLKWAQKSFNNFKVVPPNSGICHQVNLEYLGRVMITEQADNKTVVYPDSVVGLDSHTTMINGIGVMGWGVGGIEAEAVMLGQPYYMTIPEVIGFKMVGHLKEGVTATDLVLKVTEMLRAYGVVEKFVEFFGSGLKNLTIPDRATIANMSPEYGATMGFFPIDEKTVEYLKTTSREELADIVETCAQAFGLYYTGSEVPDYTSVLELDLGTVVPAVSGPARPQDRIELRDLKKRFEEIIGCRYERDAEVAHISKFYGESGTQTSRENFCEPRCPQCFAVHINGKEEHIQDGSIVVAAITSCTNTSNPFVMLGAGLVAKGAVEKGLRIPSYVKTSLAPGSRIVIRYLNDAGLMPYLEALGFHLAAFGCTTCIGNSGPLHPEVEKIIMEKNLNVASVLSGNRNFEARIHQNIKSNFLGSPMLVVAFALAGRIDIDLSEDPLGFDPNGEAVYLADIWPSSHAIESLMGEHVRTEFYRSEYNRIFDGDDFWKKLPESQSTTYPWNEQSTYIKRPPYFNRFTLNVTPPEEVGHARTLLVLGDSVTTDHISPAGAIPEAYPAGQYLLEQGVAASDFNSYGSRRGNHEVMMRGTFGNIRIKNRLVAPMEGSFTMKFPSKEPLSVFDAAMAYDKEQTPLIVIGGKEYGSGSSRDWAAKGTKLLGVKAVLAESFERIHRSNLVGMGVLPLMFKKGESIDTLHLDGTETFFIRGIDAMIPRKTLQIQAVREDGVKIDFDVTARLDTPVDVEYFIHGGILPYVLRRLMTAS